MNTRLLLTAVCAGALLIAGCATTEGGAATESGQRQSAWTDFVNRTIEGYFRNNPDFAVSAWTAEDEIMGVRHRTWPLHGVQFHPESFLTVEGPRLLKNFLDMAAR